MSLQLRCEFTIVGQNSSVSEANPAKDNGRAHAKEGESDFP